MNTDKCIIFDMDGVLIDSEPLHFDFESRLFKSLGITVSREEHETFVGTTAKTLWTSLKQTHNIPFTVQELILKEQLEFLEYLENKKPINIIPGVKKLIISLQSKGFRIALASSSPHRLINYVMDKTNINEYFQIKVSGDDIVNGKPDPDIFLKTAELINIKPTSCLVIEDSKNGVRAAKQAGMKCIGYSNPGSGNQDLTAADFILDSFYNLTIDLIQKIFRD
ncbi:MAG: HAD family phosphatase [Spirochaetales bacterium]|nr:HAD family phosphatase [Spirochaetales bacterium]